MQISKLLSRTALVVGFVSCSTTSFAQQGTATQRAACTPDVFRLCSSEIPNVDRIVACLQREKPRLSAGCQAVFATPTRTTSTRSVATPANPWCVFAAGEQDQTWQAWCNSGGRAN
jgi:hypothetical protein